MIKKETIREIIETARIEEVIGDFVSLKKRGKNLVGLCPFHNEKTPSFYVTPVKNIFKCFGCGKGGDVISFIREHEHFTYPEAIRFLAKKYNITIEEEDAAEEQATQQDEKEPLYLISSYAQAYFSEQLFSTEEGKAVGLTYFKERGFREETIRKFQLGYCSDAWDGLTREALKTGYKSDVLVKTGLAIETENRHYDRFRGRVIFPIHNLTGRVIGFGGRTLSSDKSKAKYINSPESEIYNKSKVLYGLYFARNAIAANNNCFLVEGYTDVISLHQADILNVVSSSGTSLTQDQIRMIGRYTKNITILYDGDEAGIKASFRGIDMILEQGLKVRIVLFPNGEDPDSFVRKNRTAEVQEFIAKNAVDFILFKTSLLLRETKGDPVKRVEVLKEFINTIALIPDGLDRIAYTKQSAELLDMPEQAIISQLNKIRREKAAADLQLKKTEIPVNLNTQSVSQFSDMDLNPIEWHEREIIRLILNYGKIIITVMSDQQDAGPAEIKVPVFRYIEDQLRKSDEITIENDLYNRIFDEYLQIADDESVLTDNYFINHPDQNIRNISIELMANVHDTSQNWHKYRVSVPKESDMDNLEILTNSVSRTIFSYKLHKVLNFIKDLKKQLKTNPDDYEEIQRRIIIYNDLKKNISKILGRVMN